MKFPSARIQNHAQHIIVLWIAGLRHSFNLPQSCGPGPSFLELLPPSPMSPLRPADPLEQLALGPLVPQRFQNSWMFSRTCTHMDWKAYLHRKQLGLEFNETGWMAVIRYNTWPGKVYWPATGLWVSGHFCAFFFPRFSLLIPTKYTLILSSCFSFYYLNLPMQLHNPQILFPLSPRSNFNSSLSSNPL